MHHRAVIVVIVLRGCPACEDYKPRLRREISRWQAAGVPIALGQKGQTFDPGQVPVLLVDAEDPDPDVQRLLDEQGVQGLPTTILFLTGAPPQQQEGALSDREIYDLLVIATRA